MSLTISELEAERAKILEEIENKAQDFSGNSSTKPEQPSLNSWLNAAEEIMPTSKAKKNMKTTPKKTSNYQSQVFKTPKNKVPFFGVLIVLTLLLTVLGVIYIAYSSIHKELQSVLASHEQSVEKMKKMQTDMDFLQRSIATGGKMELFVSLEDKVFALESQVLTLKEQVNSLKTVDNLVASATGSFNLAPLESESSAKIMPETSETKISENKEDKLVTESVLDESLKRYTEQREATIDQKLETILNHLTQNNPNKEGGGENKRDIEQPQAKIVTPSVPEVKKPVIEQPLVQFIKPVETPKAPKSPEKTSTPIKHYTADVKWLKSEPAMHYILQLASMPEANSLKNMVRKKQLQNTQILPQTRNGVVSYILVTGSFSDRKQANALAKQVKTEFGISPWIRKIKDISARVQ